MKQLSSFRISRFIIPAGIIFILISFMNPKSASAQNDYHFFQYTEPYLPDTTGNIYFALDNTNFFKNNEYRGTIATGATILGAWFRPKAVYYPTKQLRLELGVHVLKYTGRTDYENISPWFTVRYHPTSAITVIMGNLDQDENHMLPEPVYDPQRFYTDKPQGGIQMKYETTKWYTDMWINWRQMILPGDPFQEKFSFGVMNKWTLLENNTNQVAVPLSFFGTHAGGQINSGPSMVRTYISVSPGIMYNHNTGGHFLTDIGTNDNLFITTGPKDDTISPFLKGSAVLLSGYVNTRLGDITAAYWRAHHFYAPFGGILYQNVSSRYPGTAVENRELVNLKYHFDKLITPQTHLGFMFDLYYDTIEKKSMNAAGLYLVVNFGVIPQKKAH